MSAPVASKHAFQQRSTSSTREGFSAAVLEVAQEDPNVIVLGLDVTGSLMLDKFAHSIPEQFISVGIAEQNAASIAAAMGLMQLKPLYATYATFSTLRAADQIRVSICYNRAPVLVVGAHAGVSVGPDGGTHQALEDIALMRTLPHMRVISPCDSNQTYAAVKWILEEGLTDPTYIRIGRATVPNFTDPLLPFQLGKIAVLREGDDISIAATGHTVFHALEAADHLASRGIQTSVLNVSTIKPMDVETLVQYAKRTRGIITVEEHQLNGGLGSAIAETLAVHAPTAVRMLGIKDCFGESGDPTELMSHYGLTAPRIVEAALDLITQRA